MQEIRSPAEARALVEEARGQGGRIALVPTMGALHAGHVALLEEGKRRGAWLVLSVFVNPTQFGPGEDLARYPRDLEGDLQKGRHAGVDLAFLPSAEDMYPPGFQTFVDVREVSRPLCGAARPGHFTGVATVVLKLLHIVRPHVAIFGEKDWQQLQVVRRMVADLDLDVEIVGLPTVREADGLAMSSRNVCLSPDERRRALGIPAGLSAARERFVAGERDAARLVEAASEAIRAHDLHVDYVELRDAETLEESPRAGRPAVLAVAAFAGKTRLIDNVVLR